MPFDPQKYVLDSQDTAGKSGAAARAADSNVLAEFARSAAYSGFQAPMTALLQPFSLKAPQIVSPPSEADYGSRNWYAQQAGGAAGSLPLFLLVNKFVTPFAPSPVVRGVATGLIYEGLFHPAQEGLTYSQMVTERGLNAVTGAATFGLMGYASETLMQKGMGSSLARPTWSSGVSTFVKDALYNTARGGLSGTIGGLANAEMQALARGKALAEPLDFLRSAYTFGMMGAAMDALGTHKPGEKPAAIAAHADSAALVKLMTETPGADHASANAPTKVTVEAGSVVWRGQGRFEPARQNGTVSLMRGHFVLPEVTLQPAKRGGFAFNYRGLDWTCTAEGNVSRITDKQSGTRTKIKYEASKEGQPPRIDTLITRNAEGQVIPRASFKWTADGVYKDGRSNALGTRATLLGDGSALITGSSGGTKVGESLRPAGTIESVAVRRSGDRILKLAEEESRIYQSPDGKVAKVVTEEMETHFRYEGGKLTEVNFGDQKFVLKDNIWLAPGNKPFAKSMAVDSYGRVEIQPLEKIRNRNYPADPVKKIIVCTSYPQTMFSYDIKVAAPMEAKAAPKLLSEGQIFESRSLRGELKALKDGTFRFEPPSGGAIHYDRAGRVISVMNEGQGHVLKVKRNGSGDPVHVDVFHNGKLAQVMEKTTRGWEASDSRGEKHILADVSVANDGSLTALRASKQSRLDWSGVRVRADGLVVQVNRVGWETAPESSLPVNRNRILDFMRKHASRQESSRFESWMSEFESRCAKRQPAVSKAEIANTYYQLDKLLQAEQSLLPGNLRLTLAQQFMFKAAYPHTIGQGPFGTCNVTAAIENRFITRYPSSAIRFVTDAATTGRVTLASGRVLDVPSIKNVYEPINTVENKFDPVKFNGRDYFDQLCQTIAVNAHWQTNAGTPASHIFRLRQGQRYQPGSIRYELTTTNGAEHEVIAKYDSTPPRWKLSNQHCNERDPITRLTRDVVHTQPATSPALTPDHLRGIEKELRGASDTDYIFAPENSGDTKVVSVANVEELVEKLNDAKRRGVFPATIVVDMESDLLGGGTRSRETTRHLVNVQDIFNRDGVWYVDVTNQWGSDHNFTGRRALNVECLWEGMSAVKPEAEAQPNIEQPPTILNRLAAFTLFAGVPASILVPSHIRQMRIVQMNEEKRKAAAEYRLKN